LESDAHPAVGLIGSLKTFGSYGVGKYKEFRSVASLLL
jgi:hypothetical protein